jgi:subtilisin family serine protease
MIRTRILATAVAALAAIVSAGVAGAEPLTAQEREQWFTVSIPEIKIPQIGTTIQGKTVGPRLLPWMNPEIADAWRQGYRGQGTNITVIDGFSGPLMRGDLGFGSQQRTHGGWTSEQVRLTAPRATVRLQDFSNTRAVALQSRQLNVLNLSYGMFAAAGYADSQLGWGAREASIIRYAQGGNALVIKAAGNDAVAVGSDTNRGDKDYLASALIGGRSALFVGALDAHGTVENPADITWYSNRAGADARVQNQFLMVGVASDVTGIFGTSFAAPIVTGYAAVLGSKFTTADPTLIANRLLETARTDTISGYDRSVHGRGEASIGRALAPASIR